MRVGRSEEVVDYPRRYHATAALGAVCFWSATPLRMVQDVHICLHKGSTVDDRDVLGSCPYLLSGYYRLVPPNSVTTLKQFRCQRNLRHQRQKINNLHIYRHGVVLQSDPFWCIAGTLHHYVANSVTRMGRRAHSKPIANDWIVAMVGAASIGCLPPRPVAHRTAILSGLPVAIANHRQSRQALALVRAFAAADGARVGWKVGVGKPIAHR